MLTKDDLMEFIPYLLMGCGMSVLFLELIKVFQ